MIKKCIKCNKEFKTCDKNAKYCCRSCYSKDTKAKYIITICPYCKKEFKINEVYYRRPQMHFCSKTCATIYRNKRMVWTNDMRNKLSDKCKKRVSGKKRDRKWVKNQAESISGKNHWNWQGGKTNLNTRLRHNIEIKEWRKAIFERDDYTCQCCGKRGTYLEAHHIFRWASFPEFRFKASNGMTMCRKCHDKTKYSKFELVKI